MWIGFVSAIAFSTFVGVEGCGGATAGSGPGKSYGETAQQNYAGALAAYRKGDCLEAGPAFRRVRREFPYSRFAALAELRAADCKFEEKEYIEAVSAYRQFVRFRPSHSQVQYARFRIAECYVKQIPDDWFLAPPAHERDQQPARDALRQLRRFILDYPKSNRIPEANKLVVQVLRMLAEHELYVAKFYLRRDAYPATVGRLKTLVTAYQGSGVEAEAMLLLGTTYIKMHKTNEAREVLQKVVADFPKSDEAKEARKALSELAAS